MLNKKNILGVGVTDANQQEVLEYIVRNLEKKEKKYFIVTPNPEILVYANKHDGFKNILNNAELALTDGSGVLMAGKILGKDLKARVTGVDLMESLCKAVAKSNLANAEKPITVGFLGAGPKIAEMTADCLMKKYPGLNVVFSGEEWPQNSSKFNLPSARQNSKLQNIDILFVAFGFPKQEEWIAKNLNNIPVRVAIGVGGSFDYISGKVNRAPVWVRKAGFEWFYRLIRQPWRIKRQKALLEFIFLVLSQRFRANKT